MPQQTENKIWPHPPTPEEFGLDISVYSDFKTEKQELTSLLNKHNEEIDSVKNNWFINLILFSLWVGAWIVGFYIFRLLVNLFNFSNKYEWLSILAMYILMWVVILLPGFFEEKFNIARFVRNLFTNGKYNKATEESKIVKTSIEKLTENVKNDVRPFEDAYCDYYKNSLDEFYSTKLYKKRSGTPDFEESLAEFEVMIDELSNANKVLLTNSFSFWDLREYSEYLKKRKTNHGIQQKKESNNEFAQVADFVRKVSQPTIKKMPITPEEKYRIPRKIDWDKILKNRKETGMRGEEVAIAIEQNYLESAGRDDLASKIRHVSKEDGDGSGYDILSFFLDGKEKYIEVKSTTKSLETPFYISRNELGLLQEHQDKSFIYRILIDIENNEPLLKISSASDFLEEKELIPTQYIVKNKEIQR